MAFLIKPTVSQVRSLIEDIQLDYYSTTNLLNGTISHKRIAKLFEQSSLWVKTHSNHNNGKDYTAYIHKFTLCSIKIYNKDAKPEREVMQRKLSDHVDRYKKLKIEGLANSPEKFLTKRGLGGKSNLEELSSRVIDAYNNALGIIEFLHGIGYKHGGEGNQSNALNKKGFKPEAIISLLYPEAWKDEKPTSGHFCRKSTLLPTVTIGGSNHKSDVSEGELIDFAKKIQEYVNRLAIDIFKLPFGYVKNLDLLDWKTTDYELGNSLIQWYQNLPTLAIIQYLASNVSD